MCNTYIFTALFTTAVAAILTGCSPKVAAVITAFGTTGNAENLTRETSDPSDEFYSRISTDGRYLYYNVIESTSTGGGLRKGLIQTERPVDIRH